MDLQDTFVDMPETDDCGGQVSKRSWVVFGYKLGRRCRVSNLSVFGLLAAGRWFCFLLVGASANGIVSSDSRLQRAGNIAGLEGGRISLERLTKMMSTSVHVEVRFLVKFSSSVLQCLYNNYVGR